jgi:hypothetical protein
MGFETCPCEQSLLYVSLQHHFCNVHYFVCLWHSSTELCGDLLHYSDNFNVWWIGSLFFFFLILSGVRLGPLGMAVTIWPITQALDDEPGAVSGKRIGSGNQSTSRNPTLMSLCAPQILHYLTLAWIRVTAVGSQWLTDWLTDWSMAWPTESLYWQTCFLNFLFWQMLLPQGAAIFLYLFAMPIIIDGCLEEVQLWGTALVRWT